MDYKELKRLIGMLKLGDDLTSYAESKLMSFIKEQEAEQLNLSGVSQQRELLDAFVCTMEFDTKHGTYQEDVDYFLEAHKSV